jgi:hypothetical protein
MNKASIILGAIATFSLAVAAACGSSSGGNNAGGSDSGTSSSSSGGSSSSSSSSGGSSSGGTPTCTGSQTLCVGLTGTNTCIDAGSQCLGTSVVANECSATEACSGGKVCCSSYVGADGGIVFLDDAGGGGMGFGFAVAVQCLAQCPAGALSSQVCSDDDSGAAPACPQGTTCQDLLPAAFAPKGVPNSLCLAPLPDAGAFRRPDASTLDAGTTESDDAAGE